MTEHHRYGTSEPGSVILELGEGIGALILDTPRELDGAEIEISPAAGGPRTHSMVRGRHLPARTVYAAVYPVLPAGDYVVWRQDGSQAGHVSIRGGQASRFRWPEVTPASSAS
jgi:hypothetical protein